MFRPTVFLASDGQTQELTTAFENFHFKHPDGSTADFNKIFNPSYVVCGTQEEIRQWALQDMENVKALWKMYQAWKANANPEVHNTMGFSEECVIDRTDDKVRAV